MLVRPRPAVALGSRPLSTKGVRSRVCHPPCTGLQTVGASGLLTALIGRISRHDRSHES